MSTSNTPILICTDLDRTVLPNGRQPESAQARPLFRALAEHPDVTLAYVSGRHEALLHEAIREYAIPQPDYAIGDVGTTIYETHADTWRPWQAWSQEIAPDWAAMGRDDLAELFIDINLLRRQEPEKQNRFKLSYYAAADIDRRGLLEEMQGRLHAAGVRASLIWSIDEAAEVGLLDVLPASATKLHAVRFLMAQRGFDVTHTVFAGDSGNDLPVLTSGLQAVLVANAMTEVRQEALSQLRQAGLSQQLYIAEGGFLGMNGNYSAGVLEGVAHFIPELGEWLESRRGQ